MKSVTLVRNEASLSRGGVVREKALGVVDIGSNTVHLLVASTNGRSLSPIVDLSASLGLGGDVDYGGTLSDGKLKQLIDTLVEFKDASAEAGAPEPHFLATQALRVAANRDQVCKAITEATGLTVEIISPEQEAELAYLGADANSPSIGPQVMVDIGGGSMQVAVGQHGEVWDSVSLPLGAARVASRFLPSNPPTYIEEALLVSYLANVIGPALPLPDTNVTGVVSVGGTLRRTPPLLGLTSGEIYPHDGIERLLAMLRNRSSEEIASSYDLKPERARLLFPALLLVREVLRGYDFPPFITAAYGLREGAILYLARVGRGDIWQKASA